MEGINLSYPKERREKMSFRCDECKETQSDGTRPVVVVALQRKVNYVARTDEPPKRGYMRDDDWRETKRSERSEGFETAQEKKLCPSCAEAVPPPKFLGGPPKVVYS